MFKPKYDVCEECKHLIEKGGGQEVEVMYEYLIHGSRYKILKFCKLHAKPYSKVIHNEILDKTIYFARQEPWIQVNEDGSAFVEKRKVGRPEKNI